jgi:glycosyltransferase involved in cell wall biosynthesis
VVASYNGERTLKACLDSLGQLNYPDYEVILVDDGSTDTTRQIAFAHPNVRYFRHEKNLGLSVARNTGIAAATGEVIAFTDSDCRADEDWLYYLVGSLVESDFAGTFPVATWRSTNGPCSRSVGSTPFSIRPATTWTSAGACSKRA